jgi:hypothetical protein
MCCDVRYDFHIKMIFASSLPSVVCRRAHVLFTICFVLISAVYEHTSLNHYITMLENTEVTIKNWLWRETGNIWYTRQTKTKQKHIRAKNCLPFEHLISPPFFRWGPCCSSFSVLCSHIMSFYVLYVMISISNSIMIQY